MAVSGVGGLGFLLDRVSHSLGRDFEQMLAPFGLRATHLGVLTALERRPGLSQSEIGTFLGVERQQVVNLLNELERRDLVRRDAVAGDRRRYAVRLTDAGRELHGRARAAGADHEARTFRVLTPAEHAQLDHLLSKLIPVGRFPDLLRLPAG